MPVDRLEVIEDEAKVLFDNKNKELEKRILAMNEQIGSGRIRSNNLEKQRSMSPDQDSQERKK